MSEDNHQKPIQPGPGDWREIAEKVVSEHNPENMLVLARQLFDALERARGRKLETLPE